MSWLYPQPQKSSMMAVPKLWATERYWFCSNYDANMSKWTKNL